MYCDKCGTFLPPTGSFCPRCGTKRPSDSPSSPEKVYTQKQKQIIAVVALLLAVVGLVYSFSDHAKIIGKWKLVNPYQQEASDITLNFTFLGKVKIDSKDGSFRKGSASYSINNHILTMGNRSDGSIALPYTIQNNGNELHFYGEYEYLVRKGIIPFHTVVMILSIGVGVFGVWALTQINGKKEDVYSEFVAGESRYRK